jgi:energy-coupling factor transport system permease protein
MFNDPLCLLGVLGLLLVAVIPSKLPIKQVLKAIKPLIAVFVIIIILTCFTVNTDKLLNEANKMVLFKLSNSIYATVGGVKTGLTFFLRMFTMVFITVVFTMTTPVDDLLEFLNKVKAPYELAIIVTTSISFIPTMINKKDMIFQAQRARGANITGKGIIGQLKAYIPIMIPLIINSLLMAENLSVSMANRGYGANKTWTSMNDIVMKKVDYLVLSLGIVLMGATVYLRYVLRIGLL